MREENKVVAFLLLLFVYVGRAMRKRAYGHMDSEGPDQPAHPRSLIRAFAVQ